MTETWLRTNRRAVAFGLLPADLLLTGGMLLVLLVSNVYLVALGVVLAVIGLLGVVGVIWQMWQPRLAYRDGELLVYVGSGGPQRVPIGVVEGFLLGQGPSMLPSKRHANRDAATVVIRLAESAGQWADRETKPALAKWCGSYITLRGTWCEPLSVDLVQKLNTRLAEVTGKLPAPEAPR